MNDDSRLGADDLYPMEGEDIYTDCDACRACGKPLFPENRRIADGCPCNSRRGINHDLVAKNTCTCPVCDPAQTGSARIGMLSESEVRALKAQEREAERVELQRLRDVDVTVKELLLHDWDWINGKDGEGVGFGTRDRSRSLLDLFWCLRRLTGVRSPWLEKQLEKKDDVL